MILVIIIVKLIVWGILHYLVMGGVGIEHRAVFIGGWGPSYTTLDS